MKDPMTVRALKAASVVLALLLMVPGVEALVHVAGGTTAYGSVQGGIDAQSLVDTGDPFASLERIEEMVLIEDAPVPEDFTREVGFLPDAAEVRADETGTVVGYVVDGDATATADCLAAHMEQRGWNSVSLGGVDGATFVKSEGVFVWTLITCTQVCDETAVVVRCMRS